MSVLLQRLSIHNSLIVADVPIIVCALTGVIGFLVEVSYVKRVGYYGEVKDSSVSAWAAAMLAFYALQLWLRSRKSLVANPWPRTVMTISTLYTVAAAICFFGFAIGTAAAEGFFWFMSTLCNILTVAASFASYFPSTSGVCSTEQPILTTGAHSVEQATTVDAPSNPPKPEGSEDPSCCHQTCSILNAIVMVFVLLFAGLLCSGAVTYGTLVAYPPRGRFMEVDGYRIHYECEGPIGGSGLPVIMMDSDASHGIGDFWPLQRALTRNGRRVCTFDKPGVAFSDDFRSDQNLMDYSNFYSQMLRGTGESPPYTLLGWGGGGANVFNYAKTQNSSIVAGLIFINVYFDSVEWRTALGSKRAPTYDELVKYRDIQLRGRDFLFGIIRGLGVPWGLMKIFVAGNRSEYAWPERFEEYKWPFLVGKTWCTQYFTLQAMIQQEDRNGITALGDMYNARIRYPYLATTPLIQFVLPQNKTKPCHPSLSADDCAYDRYTQAFLWRDAINVANNVSNRVTLVVCPECGLDMPQNAPSIVAAQVAAWGR